jgi:hypothetical protein
MHGHFSLFSQFKGICLSKLALDKVHRFSKHYHLFFTWQSMGGLVDWGIVGDR